VASLDVLDETPLLDIKPYLPRFDAPATKKRGMVWKGTKKEKAQTYGRQPICR